MLSWRYFFRPAPSPQPEPTILATLNAIIGDKEFHAVLELPLHARYVVVSPCEDEAAQYRFVRRNECLPEGDRLAIVFELEAPVCP
jgi:hypothetical protein